MEESMTRKRAVLSILLIGMCALAIGQQMDRKAWPRPEVLVAPIYPRDALARKIEASVDIAAFVDANGIVVKAEATDGPCRYSSPPASSDEAPCDFAHEADSHRALGEKYRTEALGQGIDSSLRRMKDKQADTELWLASQFEVYAAAEAAAKQWVFEPSAGGASTSTHVIPLRFQFSVGDAATIQVVDQWTIHVVAARYSSPDQ